ncbi:MAG: hypothetical protein VX951_15290 [Planctomycetota bacterium]|nr:hypothetical protein [Planctomycetota bacterium]
MMQSLTIRLLAATSLLLGAEGSPLIAQAEINAGAKQGKGDKIEKPVRPSAQARAALKAAAGLRAGAKGTKGGARASILRAAAAAYEKVAADFASEPAGAAQACFAAGEVWRSLKELDKASACFTRAEGLDAARYRTRSTMELAHIARRQKAIARATLLYEQVAALAPGTVRGIQARLWIARCLASQGEDAKATVAYRQALATAATPRQRIDVCNRLANHLLGMDDLVGAEAVIQQAALAAKVRGSGKPEAVERALRSQTVAFEKMSARRALQRARDKINKAHRDAQQVEKSRGTGKQLDP